MGVGASAYRVRVIMQGIVPVHLVSTRLTLLYAHVLSAASPTSAHAQGECPRALASKVITVKALALTSPSLRQDTYNNTNIGIIHGEDYL